MAMVLLSMVVVPLLAMPHPVPVLHPVPEKRPATGGLPAGAGGPEGGRGLLDGEGGSMHAWFCGQPGNEAALPCLVQQLRALPKGPERDALQLKIREAPKANLGRGAEGKGGGGEGKGGGGEGAGLLGPQGRNVVGAMHEGWCALKENAESALCLKWRESAQRRQVAAEEKRAHPPNHKSEYVDMHVAYCDENPKNAESFPCVMHRLQATAPSSAERIALVAQLTAINPTDRMSQREKMLRFWCEDSTTDRKESGVCLSWQKKSQIAGLHDPDGNPRQLELPSGKGGGKGGGEGGGEGGKANPHQAAHQAGAQSEVAALKQRGEIETMHEWYCTSLDGTHDTLLCAKWRLRLKGAVDAYDAVAREKDQQAVKQMAQVVGDRMRELQQLLHVAKEQAAVEETARLEAGLEQARRVGQEEYSAMHKAWCTEGKGKDDTESPVCKRWREAMGKSEL